VSGLDSLPRRNPAAIDAREGHLAQEPAVEAKTFTCDRASFEVAREEGIVEDVHAP